MKLKIVPVSNHWLIYQVDSSKAVVGRIRVTPNSVIFLLHDSKARLEARELDNRILYRITYNNTVLKSSNNKNKDSTILKWKTSDESPKILKCYSKYSRIYISYKNTEITTSQLIASNTHILNIQSSDFPPIILLASLFPFLSN